MALTLTTSGSLNTTVDNYAFSILSNTSSVQLGAVSLKLVVPGGCTIKNVNAGTSSVDSLVFLQQDGNLTIGMYTLSNWVVNTNDVILSITASGMSTGSFTLNTDEDWYCEIASSSAEPFTDFAIKIPSLASPYASVSTTLEAVSILSGVNPSITSIGAPNSSVFGSGSRTLGTASIAEGINTLASGLASHAAGINTTASGQAAFSIGIETDADGIASFAAGSGSWARGDSSVAMGIGTIASASAQVTIGHYNFPLNSPDHLFVVGGGTGASPSSRGNLLEVYGGIGSTYKAVKIDVGNTFTQTSAPPAGFNVYGNSTFRGNITASLGSNIILNDDSLNFNATSSFIILDTDTLTGPSPDFNKLVINRFGINFETSNKSTSPGTKYLWTNNSNRLFYGSDAIILNGGNTLGGVMTIGTNDTNNLQLETGGTTRVFISSSGNVGVGTTSPTNTLQVVGGVTATSFTGSLFGTSSWAINALTASNITPAVTNNTDNYLLTATGGGTINGESKLRYDGLELFVSSSDILLSNNKPIKYYVNEEAGQINILNSNYSYLSGVPNNFTAGTSSLLGISPTKIEIRSAFEDAVGGWVSGSIHFITPTGSTVITNEGRLGLGTGLPSAQLHISGASNSGLLEIDSPAVNNIIYVSGSGNVGIGTGTPTNTLQVVGGVTATSFTGSLFGTSSWAVSSSNAITAQTASYFLGQNFATFTQSIASTTWTFNHNLSFRTPVITIYNSSYEVVIPDSITGTSDNQSVITFSTSQSGYATATVGSILPTNTTALMLAYAVVL